MQDIKLDTCLPLGEIVSDGISGIHWGVVDGLGCPLQTHIHKAFGNIDIYAAMR